MSKCIVCTENLSHLVAADGKQEMAQDFRHNKYIYPAGVIIKG